MANVYQQSVKLINMKHNESFIVDLDFVLAFPGFQRKQSQNYTNNYNLDEVRLLEGEKYSREAHKGTLGLWKKFIR